MKLSVNILTWNSIETLLESLFILKQELMGMDAEIIVVDNGSTDGTKEALIEKIDIKYIRNEVNLGISKGKNQGIDASQGDYILLIDCDILPVRNSVRLLVSYLDKHEEIQALGFLPNKFSTKKDHGSGKNYEHFCEKLDPVERYFGHCIYYGIYRREVFDKVRFDEAYGVGYGYEDLDSYMQMEQHGIKQYSAGINHADGKYYHAANSSIKNKGCLGFDQYMSTQLKRGKYFHNKWEKANVIDAIA